MTDQVRIRKFTRCSAEFRCLLAERTKGAASMESLEPSGGAFELGERGEAVKKGARPILPRACCFTLQPRVVLWHGRRRRLGFFCVPSTLVIRSNPLQHLAVRTPTPGSFFFFFFTHTLPDGTMLHHMVLLSHPPSPHSPRHAANLQPWCTPVSFPLLIHVSLPCHPYTSVALAATALHSLRVIKRTAPKLLTALGSCMIRCRCQVVYPRWWM